MYDCLKWHFLPEKRVIKHFQVVYGMNSDIFCNKYVAKMTWVSIQTFTWNQTVHDSRTLRRNAGSIIYFKISTVE